MSATEIIQQIEKLPPSEQERVLAFLQNTCRDSKSQEVRYADDAAFDKSAEKVLREHANLFRRLAQ